MPTPNSAFPPYIIAILAVVVLIQIGAGAAIVRGIVWLARKSPFVCGFLCVLFALMSAGLLFVATAAYLPGVLSQYPQSIIVIVVVWLIGNAAGTLWAIHPYPSNRWVIGIPLALGTLLDCCYLLQTPRALISILLTAALTVWILLVKPKPRPDVIKPAAIPYAGNPMVWPPPPSNEPQEMPPFEEKRY